MTNEGARLDSVLVEVVRSDHTLSLAAELAELGLDSILDDGILQDTPLIGTLFSVVKMGGTIRDRLLARKICKFLFCLNDVSTADRESLLPRLEHDSNFERKVGEQLFELLDRVDSHKKPEMLGKSFAAYANSVISYDELMRFTSSIEIASVGEIKKFRTFRDTEDIDEQLEVGVSYHIQDRFYLAGLATASPAYGGFLYHVSETGTLLLDLGLDRV